MNQYSLSELHDVCDQLSFLTILLATKPFYLRPKQIRQADKSLNILETFLTNELITSANQWKETLGSLKILKKNLNFIEHKEQTIKDLEKEIEALKVTTRSWRTLEDSKREKIVQNAKRTEEFLKNNGDKNEAYVIHRYNRYAGLKDLALYAENAAYLCDTLFHHENKEKYQNNIVKLEEKIARSKMQVQSITRGFWIVLSLCLLIFTLPLCLPFALNLWKKKKQLEKQITHYEDTHQREIKRLKLADEGLTTAQEIKTILGDLPFEQIRDTLMEVKDLKNEFQGTNRFLTVCAVILNFIDNYKEDLVLVFGEMPTKTNDIFPWLVKHVNHMEGHYQKLKLLQQRRQDILLQQKQMTKGHAPHILVQSIEKLQTIIDSSLPFPLTTSNKTIFSEIVLMLPDVIKQLRETLFFVTQGYNIDLTHWDFLKSKFQDSFNALSLCILDTEILSLKESTVPQDTDNLFHPKVMDETQELSI